MSVRAAEVLMTSNEITKVVKRSAPLSVDIPKHFKNPKMIYN
jgi:hypothetical protein